MKQFLELKGANLSRNGKTPHIETFQRDLCLPLQLLCLQDSCKADTNFQAFPAWFSKHLLVALNIVWFQSKESFTEASHPPKDFSPPFSPIELVL